jgi:RND family efflux transporter MFP subunit
MTLSNKSLALITLGLLVLLGGGVLGYQAISGWADGGDDDEVAEEIRQVTAAVQQVSPEAQPVQGAAVVRDTLWMTVVASGRAAAAREARVSTRTAGTVLAIGVREGDLVGAGRLLAQLDTTETLMALVEARARMEQAQAEFRVAMAQADGMDAALRAERERNLRFPLRTAELALARAEIEHEQTRVRAPFAGRVADVKMVVGQVAGAGAEVLTLVQLDPIRVDVEVLESDIPHVTPDRRASVRFTALDGESFQGRVYTVNPLVDPASNSSRASIVLANPGERIRDGMHASAIIESRSHTDRVLVPREAIIQRDRSEGLFVVRDLTGMGSGVAEWRAVTTGLRNDRLIEIVPNEGVTHMVAPGEVVLVAGHHFIAGDWPVRLNNWDSIEAATGAGGGDR